MIMGTSIIFKTYQSLPKSAQQEADDFIQFLYSKYTNKKKTKPMQKSIRKSPLINAFKDHKEKEDSVSYVKELRKKHW